MIAEEWTTDKTPRDRLQNGADGLATDDQHLLDYSGIMPKLLRRLGAVMKIMLDDTTPGHPHSMGSRSRNGHDIGAPLR